MPDDLRVQIAPIHDIIRAMGLPLLIIEGVEADDVIGTLAREATQKKRNVVISTSDKDLAQLVSDHVTLVDTMTDTRLDRDGVIAKFGVPPERIIDYLALMGDTSDNVPGVPKVGPKTAAKWIAEYGSLEEVMAQAANIQGKIGENLRASLAILPMSKQLTTIKCDVDLAVGVDQLIPDAADLTKLRELYTRFEFRPWLDELLADGSAAPSPSAVAAADKRYETIVDWRCVRSMARAHPRTRQAVARHRDDQSGLHAGRAGRYFVRESKQVTPRTYRSVTITSAHRNSCRATKSLRD